MLETIENKKSINNCIQLKLNEVLELKEILNELKKNQDTFNIMSKSNSFKLEIININDKLIFKYDDMLLIELKALVYNDNINKGFTVNYDLLLNELFNTALYIDFENNSLKYIAENNQINIIENINYKLSKKLIYNPIKSIDFDNINLKDYNNNSYSQKVELNNFIVYFNFDNRDISFLESIKDTKLKAKSQPYYKTSIYSSSNIPKLKDKNFNLDKFIEYISNGILETTFEDLETNKIEYFYKNERQQFYKEYSKCFDKYSFDEIRSIVLNELSLSRIFLNDLFQSDNKYNSLNDFLINNFNINSIQKQLKELRNKDILSKELKDRLDYIIYLESIKDLETYINSKVNEFNYFQSIYNGYIFTSKYLNKNYLDKFSDNVIKGIIAKIELNLKSKSLELFKIILTDKKLNSKSFKENYNLDINYHITTDFIKKIKDRFKNDNITLENIESYNDKISTYRVY